jgi:hypothetical protein
VSDVTQNFELADGSIPALLLLPLPPLLLLLLPLLLLLLLPPQCVPICTEVKYIWIRNGGFHLISTHEQPLSLHAT